MFNAYSIVIVVTLFLNFSAVLSQDNPNTVLGDYFHSKCYQVSGKTETFNKLYSDVYEMYQYFEYAINFLKMEKKTTFCKNERENLLVRMKQVKKDLVPCLKEEERFLADFLSESFKEALHFLCHNNGEYSDILLSSKATECQEKLVQSKSNDLQYCLNRIFPPGKGFVTKKDMCDDISVARKCMEQLLTQQCPNYQLKKANEAFFNYVSAPCSACRHLGLGSVLLVAALAHLISKLRFL